MTTEPFRKIVDLGDFLQRDLKEFTETELTRIHAEVAREQKREVVEASRVEPSVETFVDGRRGAPEDTVKPFGVISYTFQYWTEIIRAAMEFAAMESPVLTGLYQDSWYVMADGNPVDDQWWRAGFTLPEATEYTIVNDQPYHRVIEVGKRGKKFRAGHKIVQRMGVMMNARFGNSIRAEVRFLDLRQGGSGRADVVPWIIRGKFRTGQRINYPGLVLRAI